MEQAPQRSVGMLGVDWELANGAYRIKRIVRGGPWDASVRSPLDEPGVDRQGGRIRPGGQRRADRHEGRSVGVIPGARRQDRRADRQLIAIGDRCAAGRREVPHRTKPSCASAPGSRSAGRSSTRRPTERSATSTCRAPGVDAQNELVRQFMAQWKKDGLIIDERWNSGGQIPDRFIELLNRPILAYWAVRDGASQQWPPVAHARTAGHADQRLERIGRRCVSDLLPRSGPRTAHRHAHVGWPDRHQRRAGARRRRRASRSRHSACSIRRGSGSPRATASIPTSPVDDDPAQLAAGNDPQLARAIKEVTERAAKAPKAPARPEYEKRIPRREQRQ